MVTACTGVNNRNFFSAQDPNSGYRSMPPTYKAGLYRPPIPGSPELFGLPSTHEPGFFGTTARNHYNQPENTCLVSDPNLDGVCINLDYVVINEEVIGRD